ASTGVVSASACFYSNQAAADACSYSNKVATPALPKADIDASHFLSRSRCCSINFRYARVIVRGLDFGKVLSDAQHFVSAKAPVPWVCARRACGYRRGAFQLIVRDGLRRTDIADGAHRVQSWQRDANLKSEACQAIGRIISPNG